MPNKKILLVVVFLTSFVFLVSMVNFAQGAGFCEPCTGDGDCNPLKCIDGKCQYPCEGNILCNPLQYCSFEDLLNKIIEFIFYIALAIAPLMIVIAAFYFITASGDPKRVKTAKDIITYTMIGLLVILLARALVYVIKGVLDL